MKIVWVFILLLFSLTNPVSAQNTVYENNNDDNSTYTVELFRGKSINIYDLSLIAVIDSARDQKGKPVKLEQEEYEIASFTNTTITLLPSGGGTDDVITLDLIPR